MLYRLKTELERELERVCLRKVKRYKYIIYIWTERQRERYRQRDRMLYVYT